MKWNLNELVSRVSSGSGQGPYYRVYHGENMLTPKQQADILAILAKFNPSEEPKFDHYVIDWDFD